MGTAAHTDEPCPLHEFFVRSARLHPDRVAVEVPPGNGRAVRRTATYAELDAWSDAIAARLAVDAECLVAILLPREDPALFAAQLGALKAGAAFVSLEPAFPDQHLRAVLADATPVALLTDAAGRARAESGRFPAGRIVEVERGTRAPGSPSTPDIRPERLAYVIYTSGTTGRPKGVMIEHRGIANLVRDDLSEFALGPHDRVAQGSSAAYDSSVEETWLAFAAGATLVVIDDATARLGPDLVEWLRHERITVHCPPPTLLRATACVDPESELPDLKLLYVGGEALPTDLADLWSRGRRLENGYGPTECSVTITRATVRPGEPVSIGKPVRGNRAWILDEELRVLPEGETGELCFGGPGLARGYHGLPELTAERFLAHPELGRIYRTGDLARRDEQGDLFCLGRRDAQVKLRGYRIELGAIEARLAACPGVREAACALQGRVLTAHVVPASPGTPPAFAELAAALRRQLPAYMVPARFGLLERLPTTTGGKLDRAALPRLDGPARADAVAPRDALEERIAAAVAEALGGAVPGVHDDFFVDLGGDSLAAAAVVSSLRTHDLPLAVRDVYEARTVAELAERARIAPGDVAAGGAGGPRRGSGTATAAQVVLLLAGFVAGSAIAYAVTFALLPYLLRAWGIPLFLAALPFLSFLVTLLYTPLSVLLAVLVKRALIGAYRPGRAPVWGWFFVRHWLVQRTATLVPWGFLQGTIFQASALRALGARVGRRVHIDRGVDLARGGWDLLTIGDDAAIRRDAALRTVELDAGEVVTGPVTVGARAVVDVRAGVSGDASLADDALLGALSWLPPRARVPEGEAWEGVPASPAGPAPRPPPHPAGGMAPALHGVLTILVRFAAGLIAWLPLLALLVALASIGELDADAVLGWLFAPRWDGCAVLLLAVALAAPIGLLLGALAMRLVGRVRPGTMSRWGVGYLRVAYKTAALERAGRWLSGTLLWPRWLRLAGMRVGRDCEISTIVDAVPELLAIGEGSFLADGIYLGGPRVQDGVVAVDETRLGRGTFLGNHVVVPAGQRLPDDLFVGVCTVTDEGVAREGSAWFGLPAFELPRREVVAADRRLTHSPSLARRVTRWFFELARFALPPLAVLLLLGWIKALAAAGGSIGGAALWLGAVPAVTLAAAAAALAFVLALKWALLGRVQPGQHPLWSCWCSRWDFLYVAWGMFARGALTALDGTLLLAWYLRAMGARIGRGVVLGSGFAQVVDPDMLRFDDYATVCGLFQAHSFEDRVLKIDRVRIGEGATVGAGSLLFYGAGIGARATVAPHGVVLKHERLMADRTYVGAPTRSGTGTAGQR